MPWWQREPLVPLQSKSTMMVCAPTNSGKTRFVKRLLENADTMYTVAPKKFLYCYSIWQPIFDEMQRTISKISFHQGLPDEETIVSLTSGSAHRICVLDDLMDVASDSAFVQKLFFAGNHFNLTTINIVQNVFIKGRVSRCCSLNTHYFVLFKSEQEVLLNLDYDIDGIVLELKVLTAIKFQIRYMNLCPYCSGRLSAVFNILKKH